MFYRGTFNKLDRPQDIMPNDWTVLFKLLKQQTNMTSCMMSLSDYTDMFVKGWEVKATLALLELLNKNNQEMKIAPKLTFEKFSLTTDDIIRQKTERNFSVFDTGAKQEYFRYIEVFYVSKGWGLFTELDKRDDFQELKAISMALQTSPSHRIRVYKNMHHENTITVVTNQYNTEITYKLVALFNKFYPEFEIENEDFPLMLKAMGEINHPEFLRLFNKIIQDLNIVEEVKNKEFIKVMSKTFNKAYDQLKERLTAEQENLNNYERYVRECYIKIRQLQAEIAGVELLNNSNDTTEKVNDLLDYIKTVKAIKEYQIEEQMLHLTIDTPLTYYDKDFLETVFKRNTSVLGNDKTKKLLKEIFIDEKYSLITRTECKIQLQNKRAYCNITYDTHINNVLAQPHLMRHNCWGDNMGYIHKNIVEYDFIGAINQIIGATMNMNFGDSAVFRNLVDYLQQSLDYQRPLLVMTKDGEIINYLEIREEINNEDNQTNTGAPSPDDREV